MNQFDNKYKSIAFSSETENELYKKIYIISLHEDNSHPKQNIPYTHIILPIKNVKINEIDYKIPKLIKHLAILDKKTNKLVVDDNILNYIDSYIKDLSKIERLLLIVRSDLNNMNFYNLRQASSLVDNINIMIFEYELSIEFFNNTENIKKLDVIKNLIDNIKSMIANKLQYSDMLNSRILSIVSLCALPVIVLMTIWGSNIDAKNSFLESTYYKIAYRLTFLISFILVVWILYIYRKDFY